MSGTISPDGNWLWNGSEWIPAPPKEAPTTQAQSLGGQNPRGNDLKLQNTNSHDEREVLQHIVDDNNDVHNERNKLITEYSNPNADLLTRIFSAIFVIIIIFFSVNRISRLGNFFDAGGTIWMLLPVLAGIGVIMLISYGILLILNKYGIINLQW